MYPGRIDPTVSSYPAPRALAAPPCAAPIRPARSVSGFWIRQVFILLLLLHFLYINNLLFIFLCLFLFLLLPLLILLFQFFFILLFLFLFILIINSLSNPKPGHTTGESGRDARRSGQAGWGKIGCQQNDSPRKQKSTVLSKKSKKSRFNVSPEARTSEIRCKPMEEQNQRLNRN